jgi:tetratricopeptide (TPR) repeat protein
MIKNRGQVTRQLAISELEKLANSLDREFQIISNLPIEEVEGELRRMGVDPRHLHSLSLDQMLSGKSLSKSVAYAYVSDELLRDEPITGEVKDLILQLRQLGHQHRYQEALRIAERAMSIAPDYWRARNSYATCCLLLGDLDKGEEIFHRMRVEFSDNPKAIAAALHGCACAKEFRGKLNLAETNVLEVSRLYEDALKFDGSRANTRACLVINSVLSGEVNKSRNLIEESRQCEGFFEALSFELAERSAREYAAKMYKVVQVFPIWLRNLLDGSESDLAGIEGTSFAC